MRDHPTTLAAAKAIRYGCWAGNPTGSPYCPDQCAESIMPNERGAIPRQCGSPKGSGPAGLYCAHHAAKMEGTAHLRGTKVVYWFGPKHSYGAKAAAPRLWAFNVRRHGERCVKAMDPNAYEVLGLGQTTCRADRFSDTPIDALRDYRKRCADAFAHATEALEAARAALGDCPMEPGEPTTPQ